MLRDSHSDLIVLAAISCRNDRVAHGQVARGLVELARGERRDGYWEKVDGCLASGDDISAFVIPLTHSWEVETN